ncbi:hypothetical protein GCM10010251_88900 [Streptomyces aurantiogriseus]|uniref:Uncharacterized protein n=1 Tax=Streptomyces aurantiogriseus TaxID=66870 RepID=A0A918L026_9ACTN|nr:hypothetical protein GCM10010251_88900 [Streptomyces aurantiogriseus]
MRADRLLSLLLRPQSRGRMTGHLQDAARHPGRLGGRVLQHPGLVGGGGQAGGGAGAQLDDRRHHGQCGEWQGDRGHRTARRREPDRPSAPAGQRDPLPGA